MGCSPELPSTDIEKIQLLLEKSLLQLYQLYLHLVECHKNATSTKNSILALYAVGPSIFCLRWHKHHIV